MISVDRDDNNNFLGNVDFAVGRASDNTNGGTQMRFWTQPRATGAAAERLCIKSTGEIEFSGGTHTFTNSSGTVLQAVQPGVAYKQLDIRASTIVFGVGSGSATERLRIDAVGNVGINDTAPARKFSVVDSAGSMVHFGIASGHGGYLGSTIASQAFLSGGTYYNGSNWVASDSYAQYINMYHGTIRFATSTGLTSGNTFTPTERMIIKASGVTHCSNNTSDSQHYNAYNCHLHHTDDTDFTTLIENSHDSNPNCLGLHMSDAAPNNTSSMYLQCYDTASGTTTVRSAIYSDGSSYFTGGVKLGGTDAAHTLDDYEEGTWTPTNYGGTVNSGTWAASGSYTKIGRIVTVWMAQTGGNISWSAGAYLIGGLPFPAVSPWSPVGTATNTGPSFTSSVMIWTSSNIYIHNAGSSQTGLRISITYRCE